MVGPELEALVYAHVAAFNERDVDRLVSGLTPDVLWETGSDVFAGAEEVGELMRVAMTELTPTLEVRSIVTGPNRAAAEMIECWRYEGTDRAAPIGVFYTFTGDRIARVRVYREGSADP